MQNYAWVAQRLLSNYPPVPSLIPVYKTAQTTTTNETTTSFTFDLGTPHPDRMILVCCYHGVGAACTVTLDGQASDEKQQNNTHEFSMHPFRVPDQRTSGVVAVSATGSLRKAVGVYVIYPRSTIPYLRNNATANTTSDASITIPQFKAGSYAVYVGGQHAVGGAGGTFSTTRTGCVVNEDADAVMEVSASYTMGYYTHNTTVGSSGSAALVMAESVSGTKRLVTMIYEPARPSSGVAGTAQAYY